MKCGSKKKVKKFAEGGWSTSVSFDEEDAKRRAEQWAKDHPPKVKTTSAPAPKPAAPVQKPAASGGPRRFSAKGATSTPKRYVPKAFEGVDQLKSAGRAINASLEAGRKPRTTPMKPAKAGEGWNWLKTLGSEINEAGRKLPSRRYAKGGKVRGDGCASKGKTKGRMC